MTQTTNSSYTYTSHAAKTFLLGANAGIDCVYALTFSLRKAGAYVVVLVRNDMVVHQSYYSVSDYDLGKIRQKSFELMTPLFTAYNGVQLLVTPAGLLTISMKTLALLFKVHPVIANNSDMDLGSYPESVLMLKEVVQTTSINSQADLDNAMLKYTRVVKAKLAQIDRNTVPF